MFVLSVKDDQESIHIRKNNTMLYILWKGQCWKTAKPLATLSEVLNYFGTKLLPRTLFVHPTQYTEYPIEYPLHCALHHLPPEGIQGIQFPQ